MVLENHRVWGRPYPFIWASNGGSMGNNHTIQPWEANKKYFYSSVMNLSSVPGRRARLCPWWFPHWSRHVGCEEQSSREGKQMEKKCKPNSLCPTCTCTPPPIPPLLAQDPLTEFLSQQLTVCFLCSSRLCFYLCTMNLHMGAGWFLRIAVIQV